MNGEWLEIIDEEDYRAGVKPFDKCNFVGTTNYDWSTEVSDPHWFLKLQSNY